MNYILAPGAGIVEDVGFTSSFPYKVVVSEVQKIRTRLDVINLAWPGLCLCPGSCHSGHDKIIFSGPMECPIRTTPPSRPKSLVGNRLRCYVPAAGCFRTGYMEGAINSSIL
jgi:hypothetical protein